MDNASDLTFARYLALVRSLGSSKNGVFGLKLHYYQFLELTEKTAGINGLRDLPPGEVLKRVYPDARYIWLTRQDKVCQAISFLLASGTEEWWSIEGALVAPRAEEVRVPEFDASAISRAEKMFRDNDAQWQAFFAQNQIAPLVIRYEDLAADYANQIQKVFTWLNVPEALSTTVPPPRLRRQSDHRNQEWLKRYTEEGIPPGAVDAAEAVPAIKLPRAMPIAWKQWTGQSKFLRTPDETILEILAKNGYSRELAAEELRGINANPFFQGALRARQGLGKGAALLNVLGKLAQLNPATTVIEKRSGVSRDEFRDRYYAANRPVILTGLMADWRALTAWTPDYLKRVAGEQSVEVMTGRNSDPRYEINCAAHRAEMSFADYVDLVFNGGPTNDYYLVANNRFFERPGTRPLLQDFRTFPEYLTETQTGRMAHFWFGPAGTVTPLHHDTSNILMAQVTGRKRCRLIAAAQWQYVYNRESVFSEVDCENPDLVRFPKFGNANVIDFVLQPGEVLFVPVGWWHHVRSVDVSITVSFTNFVFPNHFTWGQ
jgi:LPS sulfotransferase NodH